MAPMTYFDSAAVIIGLVLFGRWLEARAKAQTAARCGAWPDSSRDSARVVRDGLELDVPSPRSSPATWCASGPARKCPSTAASSRAAPRSTSRCSPARPCPWPRAAGDEVIGGTLNTTGSFLFRATRVGRDTVLAQIVRLVEQAQGSKAPIQRLADSVTAWFVPLVLAIAAFTFVVWMLVGPEPRLTYALVATISVLIIACPCAMGLATPTAIMVATGRGAEAGILIRGGEALEQAEKIDAVVFDKTGTLTRGRPEVFEVLATPAATARRCVARRGRGRGGQRASAGGRDRRTRPARRYRRRGRRLISRRLPGTARTRRSTAAMPSWATSGS